MPLLLRPTAPSPSIDELAFAVTAAPLSSQTLRRSESFALSEVSRCPTHGQLSLHRRRRSVGIEGEFHGRLDDKDAKHHSAQCVSQQSLRRSSGILKPKGTVDRDADFRDSKLSSHGTQLDDDHIFTDGSCTSDFERISCSCSCADANDFVITSSSVVIEDRQLAVVERELRDLRKTLVRKFCSRLTKISGLARRKSFAKPVF